MDPSIPAQRKMKRVLSCPWWGRGGNRRQDKACQLSCLRPLILNRTPRTTTARHDTTGQVHISATLLCPSCVRMNNLGTSLPKVPAQRFPRKGLQKRILPRKILVNKATSSWPLRGQRKMRGCKTPSGHCFRRLQQARYHNNLQTHRPHQIGLSTKP